MINKRRIGRGEDWFTGQVRHIDAAFWPIFVMSLYLVARHWHEYPSELLS